MKLFIIAPHFPPSSLPPAQRERLMVKHLANLGVDATVFTCSQQYREEKADPWMSELAGDDFKLIELKAFDPRKTRKFGVGDLGLRFIPFLYRKLLKEAKKEKPDMILYPVPPWYLLTIAPGIKRKTGIPYAIDFIDPWVEGGELPPDAGVKRKLSQWFAKKQEGKVTRHADLIFSVSEGINEQLRERHPELDAAKMHAVPYGAEPGDFQSVKAEQYNGKEVMVRYIGAVWDDAYPVVRALLKAFSAATAPSGFRMEFYGTSYAAEGLARPQLKNGISEYGLEGKAVEYPDRVPYKEAVKLNMESNVLLLFGGMQAYYAASKLFGLIVSEKPFLAFLHRDSFPARFLDQMKYPYLVTYSGREGDLPEDHLPELKSTAEKIMLEFRNFVPLDMEHPAIRKHTAEGMTEAFVMPMQEIVKRSKPR